MPVAGSAYNYAYATMGEMIAWIIGWDLILEYIVASIAVAIGWSGYFVNIMQAIGITIPVWCSNAPGTVPGSFDQPSGNAGGAFFNGHTYRRYQRERPFYQHHGVLLNS